MTSSPRGSQLPPTRPLSATLRGLLSGPTLRRVAGTLAAATVAPRPRPDRTTHVLIAPPGHGNIGDQALVESFIENVGGTIVVVTRGPGDILVPPGAADRVTVSVLPSLVYGGAIGHARDSRRFAELLRTARSLSVVGADVMDGAYVVGASIARADAARRAAKRGVDARVLGFSWNASPDPLAVAALRRAERAGVRLLLRDPISARRARADGLADPELVADIVFAARTVDDTLAEDVHARLHGAPFAIVNASGLVGAADEQIVEYLPIIRSLRERGLGVVVLPHVSRPGVDDLPLCREIVSHADDEGVILVEHLAPPAEIRGLARRAEVTVTGRMHLAIMSLMAGVPALTVATQGKVEGLMESLGTPELCQEPGSGLGERVVAALESVAPRDSAARLAIADALPEIVRRARGNVAGLAPAPETVAV